MMKVTVYGTSSKVTITFGELAEICVKALI